MLVNRSAIVAMCLLAVISTAGWTAVFYADPSATGTSNGTSWQDAFTSLQAAVDAAGSAGGGEVWARAGVYIGAAGTGSSDSFEVRDPDAVDAVGEEADLRFAETDGTRRACHLTQLYLSGELTQPGNGTSFDSTTSEDTFTARLSDLLGGRSDLLIYANHPSVNHGGVNLSISADDLTEAANAQVLHAMELKGSEDVAKWDYVLAHLDDQAGDCSKILWGISADDQHFIADVGYQNYGPMMGGIPTFAQAPVYADRRLAFRDMIRRGSFVCLPANSKCGMPTYALDSSGGTASRMQVSVRMYDIGGAASASIKFYGCDSATGSTPGTLLFTAPLALTGDNTASYYLTSNGLAGGQPLTAEQKANIKYIRPVITWAGLTQRQAYLMPVRISSNGSWWNGPAYTLAGSQGVIGPSPYPVGGTDTGETVYFNTHCHTAESDGDASPSAMRSRYWEDYGELDPDKPRFTIITDHNRRTPFAIPVTSVVRMQEGVQLYGGFAGAETSRGRRNWSANPTIIDAEELGRCITIDGTGWSYGTDIVIDGFTLRNGNGSPGYGGGLYAAYCSPAVSNCTFVSNRAICGGGLCASTQASTVITNCTFTGNSMSSYWGSGGGVYCAGAYVTLSGCTLTGNSAVSSGGGLAASSGASLSLSDCTISGNTAETGAGIGAVSCNMEMTSCTVSLNSASGDGGGLHLVDSGPVIEACTFADNAAANGAGMFVDASYPTVRNCIWMGNHTSGASGQGGAIYSRADSCDSAYICNTIVDNAACQGGGIYQTECESTLANNIIAFNTGGIYAQSNRATLLSNDVYGNTVDYSGISPGSGDISVDPLFVNRMAQDYHLTVGSQCVDAADDSVLNMPAKDIDGQYRIWGSTPDIGADEFWPMAGNPRRLANGESVAWSKALVTAAFKDMFYVESDDRAYGIRVDQQDHVLKPGQRADIIGTLGTNDDGERYIQAAGADASGTGAIRPLLLANHCVGGGDWVGEGIGVVGQQGIAGSSDMNNIGLLVCTTGRVTYACTEYFYIDDGSGLQDGSGRIGIRVLPCGQAVPSEGSYIRVTGACSCYKTAGSLQRLIRATAVVPE